MKGKLFLSMLIIVVAVVLAFGATMAFFTDELQAPTNTFQAGTVIIGDEPEQVTGTGPMGNVNPGDCYEKCFTIINEGSKAIELRMTDFTGVWSFDNTTSTLPLIYDNGPVYIAPVGDEWKMRQVGDSFEFYYTGGPIPGTYNDASLADRTVQLCIIVAFDGPKMDDRYQGITLELNGTFSAVQYSNDAPAAVWSDSNWEAWNEPGGWFSLNHYDGLAYFDAEQTVNMGTDYADYYDTTKCFNGNGGNGGDPDPKLTIVKELYNVAGGPVNNSDVEFTANIKGGTFPVEGRNFTFTVNSPRVLGPSDGLEFDVEYTIEEVPHSDYDFASINPATFTLTEANNEITVTVVNQEKATNGNGSNGETAYAGVLNFPAPRPGGWFRVYDTNEQSPQNVYAGNNGEANNGDPIGTATVSSPSNGKVTITIDLFTGWNLLSGTETVKIEGSDTLFTNRGAPGSYTYKGNNLTVEVVAERYYLIHLDVTGP